MTTLQHVSALVIVYDAPLGSVLCCIAQDFLCPWYK